jgi:hypothetical protein
VPTDLRPGGSRTGRGTSGSAGLANIRLQNQVEVQDHQVLTGANGIFWIVAAIGGTSGSADRQV